MRSLTRVAVLMGPPLLGFYWSCCRYQSLTRPDQSVEHHTISKKALHKQGPMPTDHGLTPVKPPALPAEQASHDACDRTAGP